jgi:hypothetical protein
MFMTVILYELAQAGPVMMWPGATEPHVAVGCKVPDSIIHLDLAIETVIQDIDLAFV